MMLSSSKLVAALAAGMAALATGASAYSTYYSPDGFEIVAEMPYELDMFITIGGRNAMIYHAATEWIDGMGKSWLKRKEDSEACNKGGLYLQNPLPSAGGRGANVKHCEILLDWSRKELSLFPPTYRELNDGKGFLMVVFYKTCGFAYQFADIGGEPLGTEHGLFMTNRDLEKYLVAAMSDELTSEDGQYTSALFVETECSLGRAVKSVIFNAGTYPHIELTGELKDDVPADGP